MAEKSAANSSKHTTLKYGDGSIRLFSNGNRNLVRVDGKMGGAKLMFTDVLC